MSSQLDFITENKTITEDTKSDKEERFILSADTRRKEKIREVFNRIFVIVLWMAFGLIFLVLIARVMHLIFPEKWRWLQPDDIAQMDKFLFSSALGGVLGKYFNNAMGKSS